MSKGPLIPVTDANSGLLTGSVALTVDPAAADHLAFGRQPSSGSIGDVISPAVTVRVLDAYDHLVTTDYSDQVAVSLGSNPGAGVLGGTTTATTNGGVASFGNLSLDRPGVVLRFAWIENPTPATERVV